MAHKRRGGGAFRPPELRGTLGTLLRSALQQAGGVKDALEGAARQGRSRLDELRADRRRQDALAELGEIVLDLVRRGEIDPDELPEAKDLLRLLDDLDEGHPDDGFRPADHASPSERRRFDDRGPRSDRGDDGTVSSGARWSPPKRRPGSQTTVWRPPADDAPAASAAAGAAPKPEPRKGGISFEDDDEDLAEYMHPDDVPPKDPTGGDS